MSIALDGQLVENFAIDGQKVAGMAINGDKIYPQGEATPLYVFSGTSAGILNVYEYNTAIDGTGALITTIAKDDWAAAEPYIPYVKKCLSYVFHQWAGIGVPLNFDRCVILTGHFLYGATTFNCEVNLPSATTIGYPFMTSCLAFNQPLNIPLLATIDNEFLRNCSAFNQPLNFLNLKRVSSYFMVNCTKFNSSINLPNLGYIRDSFMGSCTAFNQPLDLPSVYYIQRAFMFSCTSFNNIVKLPAVRYIENMFMAGCGRCASPPDFTGNNVLTHIGDEFLGTTAINSIMAITNIALPSSIQSLGVQFAYGRYTSLTYVDMGGVSIMGSYFLAASGSTPITTELTVRFNAIQILDILPDSAFYGRNTNSTTHNYVNIILPVGSANVVAGSPGTWAGHTFKSVTLV